ncbi:MAG: RagB/SusD family nutrient uptake outer membrane protein [Paludibacter sp.]|nr:RagB/SusD family nutrient uptake outer membrane protein [Paludibacter sp.]
MKYLNIITKLCITVSVIFIASCSNDFLSVSPNDQLQTADSYQTPKQAEQSITGIYSNLRFLANDEYLYLSEVRSDNAWSNPKTDGLREYSEIATFRAGSDITTFNLVWSEWYKVILDANTAITKIPGITFTTQNTKDQFLGEAYFLRGWAYFELARLFGNVPIIDKPMSVEEVKTIKQSPAIDVYKNMVIPDLSKAESMLPVSSAMITTEGASATVYGRADKIAAKAMLGRIYMTMAGFPINDPASLDSAEIKLKGVIDFSIANSNKYWAADSTEWKKQWISENNNKYSIFAIQYRSGGTGNTSIFNASPALPPTYTAQRIFGNQIYIDKALMYQLSRLNSKGKPDARVYNNTVLTGFAGEKNWPAYSNLLLSVTLPDGTVVNNVFSNSMFYKYTNSIRKRAALGYTANIEAAMKDYNDWPVNYPVIRLEDVQLMYAEVLLNKRSDITGAIDIINKIRARAGADLVSNSLSVSDALLAVKAERRIELCGEGVRWFDLVRWNDWKKAISDKFDSYNTTDVDKSNIKNGNYLYPIPQTQMQVQPGLYVQNPDYN